jgi:hypothetical protein
MAEEYKRCPDCAEQVLAAARKCRYCGYRFDRAAAPSASAALARLLRRPPPPTASLSDVLAGWGTELEAGETVGYFGCCQLDGRTGFLLVTNVRIAFYAGRGGDVLIEWPRGEVRVLERRRPLGGRRLSLRGPGQEVTLSGFVTRAASAEILATLRSQDL